MDNPTSPLHQASLSSLPSEAPAGRRCRPILRSAFHKITVSNYDDYDNYNNDTKPCPLQRPLALLRGSPKSPQPSIRPEPELRPGWQQFQLFVPSYTVLRCSSSSSLHDAHPQTRTHPSAVSAAVAQPCRCSCRAAARVQYTPQSGRVDCCSLLIGIITRLTRPPSCHRRPPAPSHPYT